MKFASASEKWSKKNLVTADECKQEPHAGRFHFLAYAVDFPFTDARGSSFTSSSLSAEKFAVATVLRG
jgi:hypothetical protein